MNYMIFKISLFSSTTFDEGLKNLFMCMMIMKINFIFKLMNFKLD